MIAARTFKASTAVNCFYVSVKQGRLDRRSSIWSASRKMNKAEGKQRGDIFPRERMVSASYGPFRVQ